MGVLTLGAVLPVPASAAASTDVLARLAAPLPPAFRVELDAGTQVIGDDLLLGGDPRRLVRLGGPTLACFDALAAGATVGDAACLPAAGEAPWLAGRLARCLVDGGFAHPLPELGRLSRDDVTVVVPVHDGAALLPALLDSIGRTAAVIVVDDGSNDASAAVAARLGATVIRHDDALGPAAARNSGLAEVRTPLTLFVDDDMVVDGWDAALPHFTDPALGAVLPRVLPTADAVEPSLAARYELARSPYDLGDRPGFVAPHTRLGAGGGAIVLARTDAVRDVGGFDVGLHIGEDVDLFWSLASTGWRVRYEPCVTATHPVRDRITDVLRAHLRYGTGDASVTGRHGQRSGAVMSAATCAAMALVVSGRYRLAAAALAAETAVVARRLIAAGVGPREAVRLSGSWQIGSVRTAASVGTHAAAPLTIAAAASIPRLRPLVAAALVGRHLKDRQAAHPQMGPATWVALRTADDLAHAAGTWTGMIERRSLRPIHPTLSRPLADGRAMDAATPLAGWTTVAVL